MITRTNTALLVGLQDQGDEHVWSEFCARYQTVLIAFAQRLGLSEHDAQDAAQETLMAFADAYRQGRYDRDMGRLRSWLLGIAKNKIRYIQRQRGRDLVIVDQDDKTGLMKKVPDDHSVGELWEAQWRQAVLGACLEEVRRQVEPATVQAFELLMLKGWPTAKVASHLGMSPNAVLKAKRRVLTRIREIYNRLKTNW